MSANDLMLDVSQAAELKLAFRRNNWTNADIKALSEGDFLSDVLKVMKGQAKIETIKAIKNLINTDAPPFIPVGMKVVRHIGNGMLKWSLNKLELFLTHKQEKNYHKDSELEVSIQTASLNANVLDYLLSHQKLIPEKCKGKLTFFLGTIYLRPNNQLCVRGLGWNGCKWNWYYRRAEDFFSSNDLVALAS